RRVDFHLKGNAFSRWKYRQVDCFIAASEAIRDILAGDGVPPERVVTVHEGIDVSAIADAAPVDLHATFALPHGCPIVGNVAAIVRALRNEALRTRLAHAGCTRVSERFTVDRMVAATLRVYQRAAGRGHAADNSHPAPSSPAARPRGTG